MLLPRKKELFKLSLSELSFIVLNEEYDTLLRDAAKAEIERRFSKNGCGFDSFMERENEAISKRGKDISKYLITPKPSGQLLMETYFKYVNTCEKDNLHGNLLFSEVIICNEDGPSFVKKAFLEEIVKIKSEIDRINKDRLYGVDGFDDRNLAERLAKLEAIFRVLKRRVSKNEAHFVNTDIFRTVEDITDAPNSFCTPKYMKRLGDVCEKAATDDESKLEAMYVCIKGIVGCFPKIDGVNMTRIALQDAAKLKEQKKSLLASLKKENVDYSFLTPEMARVRQRKLN
jgi:hypothetical protein